MKRQRNRQCECGKLIPEGKHCACKTRRRAERAPHSRLYDRRIWRDRISPQFLTAFPLCCMCAESGVITAATQVDHIRPHKGNWELFVDWNNLQPLCDKHHGEKSRHE